MVLLFRVMLRSASKLSNSAGNMTRAFVMRRPHAASLQTLVARLFWSSG